ncbi:MAG: serine/threonine-protein kinase [Rhodospirillaceae bacterium]
MLPKDYQFEGYRILDVLGAGGFGITYLAVDIALDEKVAIKEFMPSGIASHVNNTVMPVSTSKREVYDKYLSLFINESRNLARIRHQNVVRIRRCFKSNGTAYIVMDFEEGSDLQTYLQALNRQLTEAELQCLIKPLLGALQAIHSVGILHRDLKPQNIVIRSSDRSPVLLDFGAARQLEATHFTAILTSGYAPIEQYDEDTRQGQWTDIYGLAAVFYRAVTGTKPQAALNRTGTDRLIRAIDQCRGKYSEKLLQGIDLGLALFPEDRPQTIAEWRGAWLDEPTLEVASFTPSEVIIGPTIFVKQPAEQVITEHVPTKNSSSQVKQSENIPATEPQPQIIHMRDEEVDETPPQFGIYEFTQISPLLISMMSFFALIEIAIFGIIIKKVLHGSGVSAFFLAILITFGFNLVYSIQTRESNIFSAVVWTAVTTIGAGLIFTLIFGRVFL